MRLIKLRTTRSLGARLRASASRSPVCRQIGGRLFPVLHYPAPEAAEWLSLRVAAWWRLLVTPALLLFATNSLRVVMLTVIPTFVVANALSFLLPAPAAGVGGAEGRGPDHAHSDPARLARRVAGDNDHAHPDPA